MCWDVLVSTRLRLQPNPPSNPAELTNAMAPKTRKKRKDANPLPWVVLVLALIVGGIWQVSRHSGGSHHVTAVEDKVEIQLSLPPPPPPQVLPPPPKVEQPPPDDEEMVLQEPVADDEQRPDDPSPEPPPGLDLGPGVPGGNGPSTGSGGGRGSSVGGSGRRGSGSKFGWYAAIIQSGIRDALARNPETRSSVFPSLVVKIWANANGKIVRAKLIDSTGKPALDQAIENQVLSSLQLPQGPPEGMPMPINLRIRASNPSN